MALFENIINFILPSRIENSRILYAMIENRIRTEAQIISYIISVGWLNLNPKYKDPTTGYTLLTIAALRERKLVFNIIYSVTPETIHEVDNKGDNIFTIYYNKCLHDSYFVDLLLNVGLNFNLKNQRGYSTAESLIDRFCRFDISKPKLDLRVLKKILKKTNFTKSDAVVAYILAILVKDQTNAMLIINEIHKISGFSVNVKLGNHNTLLHVAIQASVSPAIIQHLILKGANVNAKNSQGQTPLEVVSDTCPHLKAYVHHFRKAGALFYKISNEKLKICSLEQSLQGIVSTYTSSSFV